MMNHDVFPILDEDLSAEDLALLEWLSVDTDMELLEDEEPEYSDRLLRAAEDWEFMHADE